MEMQQRRVMHAKLLAELYNYSMFEYQTIFDTLYLLLSFAHDGTYLKKLGWFTR